MRFKVGDKVKLRNDLIVDKDYGNIIFLNGMKNFLNKELTIENIDYAINTFESKESYYTFSLEMIRDYTWEDFLKAPIGTKVILEYDYLLKMSEDNWLFRNENCGSSQSGIDRFNSFEDIEEYFKSKIIRIEEPTYMTVYEPKEITMPEIEEMKRLTDELCKTCDEFIKKIKEIADERN